MPSSTEVSSLEELQAHEQDTELMIGVAEIAAAVAVVAVATVVACKAAGRIWSRFHQ